MKIEYWIVVIILLFVAILSTGSSCVHYKPYYKDVLYHQYEPFGLGSTEITKEDAVFRLGSKEQLGSSKEGFTTPEVVTKDSAVMDIFSGLPSSLDCVGNSSGMSNSTGAVCLSKPAMDLLLTRGGNANGK